MNAKEMKELATLSPFELKNKLIEIAKDTSGKLMLNAGRGNPNFLATVPRHGFFTWGQFALTEAESTFSYMPEGVGGFPRRDGIEARMEIFLNDHKGDKGAEFVRSAISYVRDQLGYDPAEFIYEMTESILGIMYPVPDRMLPLSEKIVGHYIHREMAGDHPFTTKFDMFAVEGGTAAMAYIFNTFKENYILEKGDKIALGMPIFTPYIEIPELNDYEMVEVNVVADAKDKWQFTKEDLDQLLDPKVKAFFLVNPSNPPSVKMSDESLDYLAEIIKKRPDLIILTDDVYGTFADNFVSIFAKCPENTVLVYSFSKYFGATGWRLGVVATSENNILDKKIAALPEKRRKELAKRYSSISTEPDKIKFIDRLVADSRAVALNHTAGLITPAQVQMVLFSLFALMDRDDAYKGALKKVLKDRKKALYREIGMIPFEDENDVNYYHLFDFKEMITKFYGLDFGKWLNKTLLPNEGLFRLAEKSGVVLLPAKGFGATDPTFRVSLANLNEVDYVKIGKSVRDLLESYYEDYKKSKKK